MILRKKFIIPFLAVVFILSGTTSSIYIYTQQSLIEIDPESIIISKEKFTIDWIFSNVLIKKIEEINSSGITLDDLITKVGIGNNRIWSCIEDRDYYFHARDFYVKALKDAGLSQDEIDKWEYDYLKSLDEGVQLNFFPQFYAIGKKPMA